MNWVLIRNIAKNKHCKTKTHASKSWNCMCKHAFTHKSSCWWNWTFAFLWRMVQQAFWIALCECFSHSMHWLPLKRCCCCWTRDFWPLSIQSFFLGKSVLWVWNCTFTSCQVNFVYVGGGGQKSAKKSDTYYLNGP